LLRRHQIEFRTVSALADAMSETASLIKNERKPWRPESPATALFVDLYKVYRSETGKPGRNDRGQTTRFIKECARLIDPNIAIPPGLRQTLDAALRREEALAPLSVSILAPAKKYPKNQATSLRLFTRFLD
jgi:hypothetical protein